MAREPSDIEDTVIALNCRCFWRLLPLLSFTACPGWPSQTNGQDGGVAYQSPNPPAAPAGGAAAAQPPEPEPAASDSRPPTTQMEPAPAAPALPDLRLEVMDPQQSINFRQARFIDQSCEVLDGCTSQIGMRSLMGLEFGLRNDGAAALEIGMPSKADIFQSSHCDKAYIPGLFAVELSDRRGRVVSRGTMATKCIRTDSGSYTCSSQGLGPSEVSMQPQGACDFVDITGVEAGEYTVRVTVNPERQIMESDYDNNALDWEIRINPPDAESCGHISCGATCCPVGASCDNGVCRLPDLRVNYEAAADRRKLRVVERSLAADSCELEEACVGGSGLRRLLLFEGRLENWGPGNLDLGPQEDNPLFTYSACHDHYHTDNFAEYLLRNTDGSVAARGHKQGYCVADTAPIGDPSAPAAERPPPGRSTPCNRLTAGYADVYDTDTPCQWIDVTDVPPGSYLLEVTINPEGQVAEVDSDNNTIQVPITLSESGLR